MPTVAIHQPEFLPWQGFFNKMRQADAFIVLDHVQFKRRYFENRNRIVSPRGEEAYLCVPVRSKGRFTQAINAVEIDDTAARWREKFLERLRHFYGRSPYFPMYFDELRGIVLDTRHRRLVDLNLAFIEFFRRHLSLHAPMTLSSGLGVNGANGSRLILELCLKAGADRYLSGPSGRDYLSEADFAAAGVAITYIDFAPAPYPQLCAEHVSHLSSLDLILNAGPDSAAIIAQGRQETPCTSLA